MFSTIIFKFLSKLLILVCFLRTSCPKSAFLSSDNQIDYIKNGGITRQNGKIYEPSKVCCAVDLNTRNFWSEEYAPLCDNCKITFESFELLQNK